MISVVFIVLLSFAVNILYPQESAKDRKRNSRKILCLSFSLAFFVFFRGECSLSAREHERSQKEFKKNPLSLFLSRVLCVLSR
jgi:hypothetical protein